MKILINFDQAVKPNITALDVEYQDRVTHLPREVQYCNVRVQRGRRWQTFLNLCDGPIGAICVIGLRPVSALHDKIVLSNASNSTEPHRIGPFKREKRQ